MVSPVTDQTWEPASTYTVPDEAPAAIPFCTLAAENGACVKLALAPHPGA